MFQAIFNPHCEPNYMTDKNAKSFTTPRDLPTDICVVGGAGHIGLPLAILLASKGKRVVAYDLNTAVLEEVRQGKMPFKEEGAQELLTEVLKTGLLGLSNNPASVQDAKTIIVTIGTPVDEFHNPSLAAIKKCFLDLSPYLSEEQLVVLRSTVSPGVTEWIDSYLKSIGKNLKVAFCPERVVQGLAIKELQQFPQIISATSKEAENEAARLFEELCPEVVRLTPTEAEFAKLFANAYRYIQFAMANQFYMIANNAGVDYYRVLDGLKKNYPRARDIPKAGFAAGPCLFKDTMQLVAFSNNQFSLGHSAVLINEGLVLYIADQIAAKHPLADMTIGLLGMAFKSETDDVRSSLSYKLKKVLDFKAKSVLCTDPYVETDKTLLPVDEVIRRSDLLVLCTPHEQYKSLDLGDKPLVDVWGFRKTGTLV